MVYKQKWCFRILMVYFTSIFLVTTICEAKTTTEPCQNLGKVNDIDDLLFQFYSNIDNQCLFEMPTEELEKIWGIRIVNYDVNSSSEEKNNSNIELQRIKKMEDGFFIRKVNYEQNIPAFDIYMTEKYRNKNKGWGGSVSKGQFPKLLPPPERVHAFLDNPHWRRPHIQGQLPTIPKNTVYEQYSKYYWVNGDRLEKQPVLFIETGLFPKPMNIILYSQAKILDFK